MIRELDFEIIFCTTPFPADHMMMHLYRRLWSKVFYTWVGPTPRFPYFQIQTQILQIHTQILQIYIYIIAITREKSRGNLYHQEIIRIANYLHVHVGKLVTMANWLLWRYRPCLDTLTKPVTNFYIKI